MNKKGLTLVELLGVIVALAIIALVATPIIRGTLEDIRSTADMESARAHIEAATNFYNRSFMNESFKEKLGSDILDDLEMNNKAKEGTVTVTKDGKVRMAVVINNKCYKKDYDDTDISIINEIDECAFFTPTRCFEYQNYNDGVKITNYLCDGTNGYEQITDVVIPYKIEGLPVIDLSGEWSNSGQKCINGFVEKGLTSVIIPNTVSNIYCAFSDNQLTSVTIPDSVTSIGSNAFSDNQLTSVTIPAGVKQILWEAFDNNQLTSVAIPDSVTNIGNYAFANNQLTSVTIPNSVTSINDGTFVNNQLTSVTIPDGVTNIGNYAFENNQLTSVTIPDSVTSIGDGAFYGNQLTSVTIPNSVTSISPYVFYNNQLTSITIPDSVTSIGGCAFTDNQLTSMTIPNSVTEIGTWAFIRNPLSSITFENPNGWVGVKCTVSTGGYAAGSPDDPACPYTNPTLDFSDSGQNALYFVDTYGNYKYKNYTWSRN